MFFRCDLQANNSMTIQKKKNPPLTHDQYCSTLFMTYDNKLNAIK